MAKQKNYKVLQNGTAGIDGRTESSDRERVGTRKNEPCSVRHWVTVYEMTPFPDASVRRNLEACLVSEFVEI